jgi:tricarballylate dehydrogenase
MDGVDVLVAGGGNAALCAAIAAREHGASVLLLESDNQLSRGGNSKYTRNIRCAHHGVAFSEGIYSAEELTADLASVTGKELDLDLAEFTARESQSIPEWMARHGIRWQPAFRGTLQLSRTNLFFLGGGKALLNAYYREAARLGVVVAYGVKVCEVDFRGPRLKVAVRADGRSVWLEPVTLVVAAGGFESNADWLHEQWGAAADNFIIRGSRSNDGTLLASLLASGAMARGNPQAFHAVAVDARSPGFDGGIVTRIDSIPFGIAVNREGRRFHDEGEEVWPKRYALWGQLIAKQPGQIAYSIFDSRALGRFIPPAYPPIEAATVADLAKRLGLEEQHLTDTIDRFNASVSASARADQSRLDGVATSGLHPPKSNWAIPIAQPPFYAYAMRPGITFTYWGIGVDRRARVLDRDGHPIPGVFAAGEAMAGNILRQGYLGGFGMTIGSVFGRLAGTEAAKHVLAS